MAHKTELLMRHSSINYLEVLAARQSLLEAELIQAQDMFEKGKSRSIWFATPYEKDMGIHLKRACVR